MKYVVAIFSFLIMSAFTHPVLAKDPFSIVAVVNDDAISSADVEARTQLMLASSGLRPTQDNVRRVEPQVVNSLIEEQLKIQEAQKQNLPITPEEIAKGFETLAGQNNFTADQFTKVLESQGIPKSTLISQIKSQIAWTKVIAEVLRPQIDVKEADVNARMDRMKDKMGQTEMLVGEIFLPVNNPADEAKTKQLADKILAEMKQKNVPFEVVAAQFSKAPGAQQSGGLTWLQPGQLPEELEQAVMRLGKGDMSAPVRGLSGFHIMTLKDKRTASQETMPSEDTMVNQIGLERLDRLQQRHLSDLKAAAFIDRRS
ncbi:MAG: peptidylprolyl isomerase [Pseudomonadota bacterium]